MVTGLILCFFLNYIIFFFFFLACLGNTETGDGIKDRLRETDSCLVLRAALHIVFKYTVLPMKKRR